MVFLALTPSVQSLLEIDPEIEIIDVAVPPTEQLWVIPRQILRHPGGASSGNP